VGDEWRYDRQLKGFGKECWENRKGDEGAKGHTANDEAECGTASRWLQ